MAALNERREIRLYYFFFIFKNYFSIIALQGCVNFLLYQEVNQPHVYIYPLPLEPPPTAPIPPF